MAKTELAKRQDDPLALIPADLAEEPPAPLDTENLRFMRLTAQGSGTGGFRLRSGEETEDIDRLEAIIVGTWRARRFYSGAYDSKAPGQPPDCFCGQVKILGRGRGAQDQSVPDPSVEHPQAATCAACPRHEWKSLANGREGYECKDRLEMVLFEPDTGLPILFDGSPTLIGSFSAWYTLQSRAIAKKHPGRRVSEIVWSIGLTDDGGSKGWDAEPMRWSTKPEREAIQANLDRWLNEGRVQGAQESPEAEAAPESASAPAGSGDDLPGEFV